MKRILLLTLFLASTMLAFAQGGTRYNDRQRPDRPMPDRRGTSIRVKLSTNQMLAVSIDDRYYERRGTSLTIGDIPAGKHYLKVYNYRVGRSGNGRANVVYSGYVVLKPNSFNTCIVDPFQRKMTMRTTQTFDRDDNDNYENWNDDGNDRNYNDNHSNAMRNQDVTELGVRVKDRMTDSDKDKLMRSVLANKTYYTEQLRTMMGWLSFESTKLEFAKWAYDNTIDKENYWKLEDIFSFSSSKNELTDYVQQKGPVTRINDNNDRYVDDRNGYKDNRNRDNYENNSVDPNAMSDRDIADLGARVKDRIGDSDKLKLIQSVLNGKTYYTQQVRTMIGWLSFESTKLDLAKWAYGGTIDRESYWKLEDVFSFSSSKDELNSYIQGGK
jgi:hypothetical protein